MRTFLRILTFVLVGPPAGTLAFLFGTGFWTLLTTGRTGDLSFVAQGIVSPMILTFGYVLGGVPALLAGIAASVMARRMAPGWMFRVWVAVAGAIAGFIGTVWFVIPNGFGGGQPGSAAVFLMLMALTGAAAAFVSILVFDGLSRLRARTAVA